jgi:hypothetical protein
MMLSRTLFSTGLICMALALSVSAQESQRVPSLSTHSSEGLTTKNRPTSDSKENGAGKPVVSGSEAVITIHGLCNDRSIHPDTPAGTCETVITRDAFERLLNSMNVLEKTVAPETRRNLAEIYAEYRAFEGPATNAGLEATPRFQEIMRWWRLRTLAGLYRGSLQEQFKNVSLEEIHAYYLAHLASYQRLTIARIMVPHPAGSTDEAKRKDQEAHDALQTARERIARGEDPDVVQKDAYSALGLSAPPTTKLGTNPRTNFPTEETDELFSLKPGEVSKVENEGSSYVIYKILSNETLPEEKVKEEVSRTIAQTKYDDAIRAIEGSAKPELNEAYFGPPAATHAQSSPENPHP